MTKLPTRVCSLRTRTDTAEVMPAQVWAQSHADTQTRAHRHQQCGPHGHRPPARCSIRVPAPRTASQNRCAQQGGSQLQPAGRGDNHALASSSSLCCPHLHTRKFYIRSGGPGFSRKLRRGPHSGGDGSGCPSGGLDPPGHTQLPHHCMRDWGSTRPPESSSSGSVGTSHLGRFNT